MVAARMAPNTPSDLSPTAQAFVGDALELVIHSVETVRERISRLLLRRRSPAPRGTGLAV